MGLLKELSQKQRFNRIATELPGIYKDIRGGDIQEFLMPFWSDQNDQLENVILPKAPYSFLDNPLLRNTMFVTASEQRLKNQLPLLEKHYGEALPGLLKESRLDRSEKIANKYTTSGNTVHHLYHFALFETTTKHLLAEINSVVEWGGGYGNMAKIFRRVNEHGTYTIIDTALFSSLQWLYLSTVLPESSVNIIRHKSDKIRDGKINILPLKYLKTHLPEGELFISTWGLSESTDYAQDFVVNNKWFGAKKILLGFQDSTDELSHASRLGKLAKKAGSTIKPISYTKNNYYAFK
jgi:hypothetical protein